MRQVLLVLTLLAALSCGRPAAPGGLRHVAPAAMGMDAAKLSRVDSVIGGAIADGIVPGAVLAVVREDKLVYLKAYGHKSVVPDTVAMTTDVIFDLASCSKVFGTTLSFMQLVENGQVRLSDKVDRYIPGFRPWVDPATGEAVDITVRDLLTHASGLPAYDNVNLVAWRYGEPCPDSLMRRIACELPRGFRPGSDFMYSCLNFVTLQHILQNVTGEKLEDYARRHVFEPMGLAHTCYNVWKREDLMPSVAPTEVQADGKPFLGTVHDPIAWRLNAGNSGNAGLFSTAEDLSVLAAAVMNGGAVGTRRILAPLTVQMMATVPPDNAPHIGRALGWDCWSDYSGCKGDLFSPVRTLSHTGYTGTSAVIDLDAKCAVILLAHRVHPTDEGSMARVRACVSNTVAASILR